MNNQELNTMTKEQYIPLIIELMQDCNDLSLLDLVYRLFGESI